MEAPRMRLILRRSFLALRLGSLAFALAVTLALTPPLSSTRPAAACPSEEVETDFGPVLLGGCAPGAGVIGAIPAAAGRTSRANRARAAAAAAASCAPITASNAAGLVLAGSTNVGAGQRLKWSPVSDAFYTLGQ